MRPMAAQSPLRLRSSCSRTMKSAPCSRMRGTRTTAPSARRPSTSASAKRPCLRKPLARGETSICQIQPVDEDAEEGAVELGAAAHGRLLKIRDAHAQHARFLVRRDGGAALVALRGEVGHLAEALADAEHGEELLVLGHAHLALDHDAEEVEGEGSVKIGREHV